MQQAQDIAEERYKRAFGRSKEDVTLASETVARIQETVDELDRTKRSKVLYNLPWDLFEQVTAAFTPTRRGLMAERYYARLQGFTQTNEAGRGDLTDGYGMTHEVKTARAGSTGTVNFGAIRLKDEVSAFHFLHLTEEEIIAYQVPRSKLQHLPLYRAKNTNTHTLQFLLGGGTHVALQQVASSITRYGVFETGARQNSHQFLVEAKLTEEDLHHLTAVRDDVSAAVAGTRTVAHVSWEDLMSIKPLVNTGKFGLLFEDWLNDHLEIATSRVAGRGDSVSKEGRVEVKFATAHGPSTQRITIQGLRPTEFDTLYLGVVDTDGLEVFRLAGAQAKRFVRTYGKPTKKDVYRMQTSLGPRAKAYSYLRRHKVDLNTDVH